MSKRDQMMRTRLSQGVFLLVLWFLTFPLKGEAGAFVLGQLDLVPGLNLVGLPVDPAVVPDSHTLLPLLGNKDEIDRIQWLNPATGIYEETSYDGAGNIVGPNFPVHLGDAWLVYAKVAKTVAYNSDLPCPHRTLNAGTNLVGFPCFAKGLTAYEILDAMGGPTVVSSIQRLDQESGQFETAGYSDGVLVGPDFPILPGDGYFIFARTNVRAPIVCGQLVSGQIAAAGEVDLIAFRGQAGAVVDLTFVQTAGFDAFRGVLAYATVFAPSGATVVSFNANSQNTLMLPESGTYVVRINANNLVHTGSYTLGMECRNPLRAVDGAVACGDLLTGTISAAGEVDLITFTGQVNDVIDLTFVQTAGFDAFRGVLAHATVFAPSGVQVDVFDANAQRTLTLAESGTYVVRINANNLVSTGSYSLGLLCF